MGLLDRFRRNRNEQGQPGRVARYDREAGEGTIALEDGSELGFRTSDCMFTPFVDLPVQVVKSKGGRATQVRLAESAQQDYLRLLDEQAAADEAAREQAARDQREARREALRRRAEQRTINPEIEARIEQDPDDLEARQVYADLLLERGEPLGELMAAEHALEQADGARRQQLAQEVARLRAEHEQRAGIDGGRIRVEWRLGLIEAARVAVNWPEGGDYDDVVDDEQIDGLLGAPAARFLRRLTFGLQSFEPDSGPAFGVLEEAGPLTALRELFVGDFVYPDEMEMSWYELGPDAPPWAALPGLQRLVLQAGQLELGQIEAPRLEHFEVRTGGLTRANLASIREASWPELRSLVVWFGDEGYGAECTIDDVQPLLEGQGLERVTTLGLCNAEFTDALCDRLPRAPILPRLRVLDLSRGTMSDAGARTLAAARESLAHLERLDVTENLLTDDGVAQLQTLGCEVTVGEQREWYDDVPYVAVGE